MVNSFSPDMSWWISAVDVPVMLALFWFSWKTYRDNEKRINDIENILQQALLDFKLEVAERYAKTSEVKEIEKRVVSHLLRIESKLDVTALKAESIQHRQNRLMGEIKRHERDNE